jgi:hypothetical protein
MTLLNQTSPEKHDDEEVDEYLDNRDPPISMA